MSQPSTVGTKFKELNILHAALCIGLLVIIVVLRYLVKQDNAPAPAVEQFGIFRIIGVGLGFVNVLLSRFFFFKHTSPAMATNSLKEKFDHLRAAFILQMALLEGAGMINIIFYFLTKDDLHFFVALGILLLMIVRRPTRSLAAIVLFNDTQDKQQIYNDYIQV